jgi:hypothetical protein
LFQARRARVTSHASPADPDEYVAAAEWLLPKLQPWRKIEYVAAAEWLLPKLQPWRKMTIAIDGVDHAGKSSLGRFLAWQAEMPVIETDFTLIHGSTPPAHDGDLLRALIDHRHRLDRPVLIEGIFVLRQLDAIGVNPELLIEMRATGPEVSSWEREFAAYRKDHPRAQAPDFVVTRLGA